MNNIIVSFYFPHNWYQYRSVSIKGNNRRKLGRVRYGEELNLKIPENTEKIKFGIDFYKESLYIDTIENSNYAVVYFDIKNNFSLLNPKILKVKTFNTVEERNAFCKSLYANLGESKVIKEPNKTVLLLGSIISLILALNPFYPEQLVSLGDGGFNLAFFIGLGSLVSMIILNSDKKNITIKDYKLRITSTILAFILSLFFIESKTLIAIVAILTMVFFIRSMVEFKRQDQEVSIAQ